MDMIARGFVNASHLTVYQNSALKIGRESSSAGVTGATDRPDGREVVGGLNGPIKVDVPTVADFENNSFTFDAISGFCTKVEKAAPTLEDKDLVELLLSFTTFDAKFHAEHAGQRSSILARKSDALLDIINELFTEVVDRYCDPYNALQKEPLSLGLQSFFKESKCLVSDDLGMDKGIMSNLIICAAEEVDSGLLTGIAEYAENIKSSSNDEDHRVRVDSLETTIHDAIYCIPASINPAPIITLLSRIVKSAETC